MHPQEHPQDHLELARMMIDRHGLRAGAIAEERAHEAQHAGAARELDRWRSVQAAISELRRTERESRSPIN